jgi:hypothetical protein
MLYFCSFFFTNLNVDASEKFLVATEILLFDFGLLIDELCQFVIDEANTCRL